jgi:hypothetical protein
MKLFWFFIFNHHQQLQQYTIISSSRESDVKERLYRRFNNALNNRFHRPLNCNTKKGMPKSSSK